MSKLTIVERGIEELDGDGVLPMMLNGRRDRTLALALEFLSVRYRLSGTG